MKHLIHAALFFIFTGVFSIHAEPPKPPAPINLNTADAFALSQSVKGIGIKRAQAIVKYRETHQGFKSLDELSSVPGLGPNFVHKHFEEIKAKFTLK